MQNEELNKHEKILKKNIFFIDSKWPQFQLLINDIKKFSINKKNKRILSLESGSLYGNISLFAPYFREKNFTSVDCSTKKIYSRGAYNKRLTTDNDLIKIPIDLHKDYKKLNFKKNTFDLILIPNLMHHIFDHNYLLRSCRKFLKKNGTIYIFEPTLREIHQIPDDFFRFTPYGLKKILENLDFKKINFDTSGGPFTAAHYCLDQASQFLPKKEKKKFDSIFKVNNSSFFNLLDLKYKKNLVRKNNIFPTSFSIMATK